jgi:putative transposase
MEHLSEGMKYSVKRAMNQAYYSSDYETARKILLNLINSLKDKHPGAARSLEEGFEQTLTINRLGLPERLAKTLRSTNVIENMFNSVNNICRNVKRWQSGSMVERWVCTGIIEAEKKFKRINGCTYIPLLDHKLRENDLILRQETLDRKEEVA